MSLKKLWEIVKDMGSLVCCSPWDFKELDTAQWLNNKNGLELNLQHLSSMPVYLPSSLLGRPFLSCLKFSATYSETLLKFPPQMEGVTVVSNSFHILFYTAPYYTVICPIQYISRPLTRNLFMRVGIVSDLFLFFQELRQNLVFNMKRRNDIRENRPSKVKTCSRSHSCLEVARIRGVVRSCHYSLTQAKWNPL